MKKIELSKCPLCGKPNECAIVAGDDPATCWCMKESIPKELRDFAQKERERKKTESKSCICRECVEAYKKKRVETETRLESDEKQRYNS